MNTEDSETREFCKYNVMHRRFHYSSCNFLYDQKPSMEFNLKEFKIFIFD